MTNSTAREALMGTTGGPTPRADRMLTPGEVAAIFRVDPKTVTRWANTGRLASVRTPGGHCRFRASVIRDLLDGES